VVQPPEALPPPICPVKSYWVPNTTMLPLTAPPRDTWPVIWLPDMIPLLIWTAHCQVVMQAPVLTPLQAPSEPPDGPVSAFGREALLGAEGPTCGLGRLGTACGGPSHPVQVGEVPASCAATSQPATIIRRPAATLSERDARRQMQLQEEQPSTNLRFP
jgi:hypothetical protein